MEQYMRKEKRNKWKKTTEKEGSPAKKRRTKAHDKIDTKKNTTLDRFVIKKPQ